MKKIKEVIVVEGESDRCFLQSFLEADIVITNGSEISEETLSFIEELSKTREILVMTDPDSPGKRIRQIIQERIKNCKHCHIEKEKAIKGKKVGIAETKKEDILKALENILTYKENQQTFFIEDMIELGFIGKEDSAIRRDKICKIMHIDKSNGKSLLKKFNMLGLKKNDVIDILGKED